MLLDMRFPPQPALGAELRRTTDREAVQDYVLADDSIHEYLKSAETMIRLAAKGYRREGKRYMTIAAGCTGGKYSQRRDLGVPRLEIVGSEAVEVHIRHRDLGRE